MQSAVIGLDRRAEELGFDGVRAGDSLLAKPHLVPLSTLTAVGGATESIALGTAVYCPSVDIRFTLLTRRQQSI